MKKKDWLSELEKKTMGAMYDRLMEGKKIEDIHTEIASQNIYQELKYHDQALIQLFIEKIEKLNPKCNVGNNEVIVCKVIIQDIVTMLKQVSGSAKEEG